MELHVCINGLSRKHEVITKITKTIFVQERFVFFVAPRAFVKKPILGLG